MQRRNVLGLGLAAILIGQPVFAKDFADRVVDQLRDQGFSTIRVERTLLGRTRIQADSREGRREIILNPRTGEILRDLWVTSSGQGGGGSGGLIRDDDREDGDGQGRGRGRGRGGDDNDDNDSDSGGDRDSGDSDNSGKGGGSDDD